MEEIVDLNGLVSQACGLDLDGKQSSPEVAAMVTKLLSRAEMLASPEALAALRSEADGLIGLFLYGTRPTPGSTQTSKRKQRTPGLRFTLVG